MELLEKNSIESHPSLLINKSLRSEIGKETEVLEIKSDSAKKYESVLKETKPYLSDFHSGKSKVLSFQSQENRSRSRRSEANSRTSLLNVRERSSFLELYKSFEKMEKDSLGFLEKLQKISSLEHDRSKSLNKPRHSELAQILNRIGWSKLQKIQLIRPRKKNEPQVAPNRRNSFNWKSWAENPYKKFFSSEEEYYKLVEGVNKAKQEYENYMRSKRGTSLLALAFCSTCQDSIFSEKSYYQSKVDYAKSAVDMVISSKLFSWMNL
ncbi:hypothetical protein [Candidatus Mycoplasma haematominutum]|uniref:Uncharacterized protein n=1 Tax=Candidatus Mycoplasma haematominutum 'Birmingham 1' TaxID=1116213 RepID=G8C3I5_9MOLU|nr:hypothetical protein [Candidatus Mycoplasma haematominutum]CCE66883.1 hypothetical protein MHM_03650 [Candidatus Mycoplasma haematominutum 'Birmingham 1']